MTEYNGRSASYQPGKEVPNKEPPISKYVVEKLYRVHRTRMAKMQPVVDCHVKIPSFLTDQSWKKTAEIQKQKVIERENSDIYKRIAKVEKNPSLMTKDYKEHIKRINIKSTYLKKLKDHGRLVNVMKIQKENEYFLQRIDKAQPQYGRKKLVEWYRHHERFKEGRRSDPTSGHIFTTVSKDLYPKSLPPLNPSLSSSLVQSSVATDSIYSPNRDKSLSAGDEENKGRRRRRRRGKSGSPSNGAGIDEAIGLNSTSIAESNSMLSVSQSIDRTAPSSATYPSSSNDIRQRSFDSPPMSAGNAMLQTQPPQKSAPLAPIGKSVSTEGVKSRSSTAETNLDGNETASIESTNSRTSSNGGKKRSRKAKSSKKLETNDSEEAIPNVANKTVNFAAEEEDDNSNNSADEEDSIATTDSAIVEALNEFNLMTSRPMALPFEAKNCLVHVYTNKNYDENLYIKVLSGGIGSKLLSERQISIDQAYELVNAGGHSSQIVHSSENEDLASLSTLLINMFKEADDDGSGSLTFDEFQILMEKVELGISPQELRFVISEADENENGVVDYEEFVPLAVDLIQSFRARNRAKTINSQKDVEVDEMIMQSISKSELEEITHACLEKIFEIDSKKYGLIRVPELKKCLQSISSTVGLRDNEVSMICQMLPRDQFDRIKYNATANTFYDTLSKVRFTTMKNAMIESQGSGLQKYLLDLCRDEEANIASKERLNFSKETFVHTGRIPMRGLINILSSSSRLSLSRLQVLVIMSEAHVQEGMINYFQFVPVVAKAIEIMFEPKALRQRAELIEKTDLSPEALLQGMSSEMFEHRLLTLFKSYDIDHSGGLDQNEFVACLESLDLQLTYGEMVALFAAADINHSGILQFKDFVGFFTQNLLNLEREKHLRLLQTSLNKDSSTAAGTNAAAATSKVTKDDEREFINQLTAVFKLSDPEDSGLISVEEFETVIKSFDVTNSSYLMDVMLSELHPDDNGMVQYRLALTSCAELLKVYRARESAMEENRQKEEWASTKAEEVMQLHIEEIHHIVRYLRPKIKHVHESCADPFIRYNELLRVLRNSSSGLARVEANMLIQRLINDAPMQSEPGSPKIEESSNEGSGQHDHKKPNGKASPSHGVSSFHLKSMKAPKLFRSVFSYQELFDAIYDARKITIMRGLIEEVDSTALRSTILEMLNEESQRLKNNKEIPADSDFIPVDSCFKVLENAHQFRLNHSQIMFIISWAECFDKDGEMLETDRFAEHCAEIISKLNVEEMLDTRTEIMKEKTFDEKTILNGMKEKDLEKHLEYAFSTSYGENGTVDSAQLTETTKGIPRLALSDREVTTIVAALHIGEPVYWKDILHQCVSVITQLCRERVIHRRVSLAAVTSRRLSTMPTDRAKLIQGYASTQITNLAERLLNYIKLENDGDLLVIRLPIDNTQRKGTQLAPDDGIFFQKSESNILYRATKFLPWYELKKVAIPPRKSSLNRVATAVRNKTFSNDLHPVGENTPVSSGPSKLSPRKPSAATVEEPQYEITTTMSGSLPVMLSVHASENTQTPYTDTQLVATVIDCRSMIEISSVLDIKLPTIGLVDRDAAEQFARNVCERIFIEESVTDQTRKLKLKPE